MERNSLFAKKGIFTWCLYDWANGPFSAIVTTFIFATFFTEKVVKDPILGTTLWGNAIAIAGLIIALLSPLFGAIADHEGRRKPWLGLFSLIAIVSASMLWFALPDRSAIHWMLTWVVLGTIGLEMGIVFFNAMLRDIAPKDYVGRLSGWAWAMSYFANLTALIIALFVFVKNGHAWFGLDLKTYANIRINGPFVAVWFMIFAWPLFIFTPDRPSTGIGLVRALSRGLTIFFSTFKKLPQYGYVFKFLIARMLYVDGLNTIFAFGGIYAAGTFGMHVSEVITFGLTMNLAAGMGAAGFSWMDDHIGAKKTIVIALFGVIFAGIAVLLVHDVMLFWGSAFVLSVFIGPAQAASRSLMARIAPPELMSEMFGLYAFSGKATSFVGPWLFGYTTYYFGSQRAGMASTLFFVIAGLIVLTLSHITGKDAR